MMEGGLGRGTILLGKYRVERVLGRGGMGIVLLATHLGLGEEVALKILSPELLTADVHARFVREAQSVVKLHGEHVARVSDIGVLPEGAPYIVMEYLRGVDLAGELKRRGSLGSGEAVDHVLQVCEALAEAHAHGIVHRDLKPSNLFLTARPDGTPLIKVLDFGISKAPVDAGSLTRTDAVMGTPGYMSPEQMKAARDVDARTDIWALGTILYELLSGRLPFQAESFSAIVFKVATEPPPLLDPRLPRGLRDAVLRCLVKDRSGRFASVAELALALAPFARDQRAASLVVDRARLMLGTREAVVPPAMGTREATPVTTLSGSARTMTPRPPYRRYAIVGAAFVLVSSVLVAVSVITAYPASSKSDRSGSNEPSRAAVLDAAAAPDAKGDIGGDGAQELARCVELAARRDWQALNDCGAGLKSLGLDDRARAFRDMAVRETRNALVDQQFRSALHDSDLKRAEKLLQDIDRDSVYAAAAHHAFDQAATAAAMEAQQKAQALADAHDCAALTRYAAQVAATSIASASTAVAAVPCAPRLTSRNASSDAKGQQPAPALVPSAALSRTDCQAIHPDDLMTQAARKYGSGDAKAALSLAVAALRCQQTGRMYWLAAMYACAAQDSRSARRFYDKVPSNIQPGIVNKCRIEGIDVRGPAQ